MDRVLDAYEDLDADLLSREEHGSAALVRFSQCACCEAGRIIPTFEGAGGLFLPPSQYGPDGETYQFLFSDSSVSPQVVEGLPDGVHIVHLGTKSLASLEFENGFLVPVGVLFHDLTERQRTAVLLAVRHGYYRIPRKVRTAELAEKLDISRPAFEALLRKAENKIVRGTFPYLQALTQD